MKPVKSLLQLSKWLLRITLLTWLVIQHGQTILALQYQTQSFYIALAFVLFGTLLFAGGFTSKPSLTVISAMLLVLLFAYSLYLGFVPAVTSGQVLNLLLLSVSMYFMAAGNK